MKPITVEMIWGGSSAMGEGLQWFCSTIADLPGGRSPMGEGLQYNTGTYIYFRGVFYFITKLRLMFI